MLGLRRKWTSSRTISVEAAGPSDLFASCKFFDINCQFIITIVKVSTVSHRSIARTTLYLNVHYRPLCLVGEEEGPVFSDFEPFEELKRCFHR